MARGQSAMNELSDDERNLLRYFAETLLIIHEPVRGAVEGEVRCRDPYRIFSCKNAARAASPP